jgi:sugar lactone lactonase YvrE
VLAGGIVAPGGLAEDARGRIYVGFGNTVANGQHPERGGAGVYRVDPRTGRKRVWARGLAMANGLARLPDGTLFASDDFAPSLDRVSPERRVERGWKAIRTTNGLAVGPGARYLYVNQSFGATRIVRIDLRHPRRVAVYAAPAARDAGAILDGLAVDRRGTLFAAAWGAGEVWRVDGRRRICALARGLVRPSSTAVGHGARGFSRANVYVGTHGGTLEELRDVAAR